MQVRLGRRAVLGGLAASLAGAGAARAAGAASAALPMLSRWETGNTALSPPAQVGGRIAFCGDRNLGVIDPVKATPVWQQAVAADQAAVFRPRVDGGRLVFGARQWIATHDAAEGTLLWRYEARIQTGVPLASGGTVYFGDGHEIVAIDGTSGAEKWRFAGVPDTLASYAPTISGDTVFAGPGDGRLYALSAGDGRLLWQSDRRAEWQYLRQLQVSGNILIAGSYKEKLFGIDTADGRLLWQFNAGNFINSHHVADAQAFLWSPTGFLYAIDALTGTVRWQHETTDYDEGPHNWAALMAELVTSQGLLYALDMANELHVLNAASGAAVARVMVPDRVRHAVLPLPGVGLAFPTMAGALLLTANAAG